jgi:KUP system potassium uptake protein
VTGAEMLYADLGHFGRKPIRLAWFCVAFPGLLFNYMGQGAYLLSSQASVENLFYRICPQWFLYPMIALATGAAMIASQAVISGAFSLARQSVHLGFWPRIQILHTSSRQIGQVYVPLINWTLLAGTILLILGFRKSGNLAAAYGIAVSIDMLITAVLITIVARKAWRVPLPILIPLATAMLAMDTAFFCANVLKIPSGGWIVLVIACSAYTLMRTWLQGRDSLRRSVAMRSIDLKVFLDDVTRNTPLRVPGVAVFLSGNPNGVPGALLHNMKHNMVLHEHTVILSVTTEDVPFVQPGERSKMESLGNGMYRLQLHYGFSENPDIPAALRLIKFPDFEFNPMRTTFFLGREALVVTAKRPIPVWRKRIFWFMSHNATTATSFFNLPHNRVVELGAQIEL